MISPAPLRRGLGGALLATIVVTSGTTPASAAGVDIPDPGFRTCLQSIVGTGVPLTEQNLGALETVSCMSVTGPILDLAGIDHLVGMTTLTLPRTQVIDLSPLTLAPQLQRLHLGPTPADLAPLGDLPNLRDLILTSSPDQDLDFLTGHTYHFLALSTSGTHFGELTGGVEAEQLAITGDAVTTLDGLNAVHAGTASIMTGHLADLSAVSGWSITEASLFTAADFDLSPLAATTDLQKLTLYAEHVTDLGALGPSTSLTDLAVTGPTSVTSLGAPGSLKELRSLSVPNAAISSIEALRGTTALTSLDLRGNRIEDLSPLREATGTGTLHLGRNRVHDFSPLARWRGPLDATLQEVRLPATVVNTPTPVTLRDRAGRPLQADASSRQYYSGGELSFPDPGTWRASFSDGSTSRDTSISVEVTQVVKAGARFTRTPRPTLPAHGAEVGRTLTPILWTWQPTPSAFAYRWFRDALPISGATGSHYTPTGADVGHMLAVQVAATRQGYATTAVMSTSTDFVVKAKLSRTPRPAVRYSGRLAVGTLAEAVTGPWTSGVRFSYQWQNDGRNIKGATSSTYRLRASDVGDHIRVKVTGRKSGYHSATRTSAPTKKVARARA